MLKLKISLQFINILLFFFAILLCLCVFGCGVNPESEINYEELKIYLEKNYENLNLFDTDISQLQLIDSLEIAKNQVILVGEYHAIAINTEIEWFFTRYFHEHGKINYLLQEMPFSAAQYENKYLETGNKSFIDTLFSQVAGTFNWTKERYNFLEKVYAYNITQPDKNKLIFIGIDIEHQDLTALRYIATITDTATAPPEISDALKKLVQLKNSGWNITAELEQAVALAKTSIDNHRSLYEQYFGNNFINFEIVIENMINKKNAYKQSAIGNDNGFNQIRDSAIFETFLKIYPSLPLGNFFGQWGMDHVFQKEEGDICFFGAYLNSNQRSPVRGKILSIANIYNDCQYMDRATFLSIPFSSSDDIENIVDEIANEGPTLFKLINENSPFMKQLIWIPKNSNYQYMEGSTTNYFQYAIYVKNSNAAHSLQ